MSTDACTAARRGQHDDAARAPARRGPRPAVPGRGAQRPDEHGHLVRVLARVQRDVQHPGPGRTAHRRGHAGVDARPRSIASRTRRSSAAQNATRIRVPPTGAGRGLAPLRPPLRRRQRGLRAVPEHPGHPVGALADPGRGALEHDADPDRRARPGRLDLRRRRLQRRGRRGQHGLGGGRRIVVVPGHVRGERRQRMQPERRLGDQPQRPERPGEQLPDVVAGHVLDDLPAGVRHPAVGAHHGDPDQQVARRAVAQPQRARPRRWRPPRRPSPPPGRPARAAVPSPRAPSPSCPRVTPASARTTRSPAACSRMRSIRVMSATTSQRAGRRSPRDRPPAAARHDGHAEGGGGASSPPRPAPPCRGRPRRRARPRPPRPRDRPRRRPRPSRRAPRRPPHPWS